MAYLRLIYPDLGPEDIVASRISRSRYVFPVPLVGGSPPNEPGAPTSVPGLFLVSSASLGEGTSTVEQSLALAEAALSRWERDGYCRTADANPTDKAVL